jgi:hypothetical protein
MTLTAFQRDDPSFNPQPLIAIVEAADRLSELRAISRELRAMSAAMSPSGRATLRRQLHEQFGSDLEAERDRKVVDRVRRRGRIRSEREYRVVESFADSLDTNLGAESEFLALGALLDAYMAAPQLPNER